MDYHCLNTSEVISCIEQIDKKNNSFGLSTEFFEAIQRNIDWDCEFICLDYILSHAVEHLKKKGTDAQILLDKVFSNQNQFDFFITENDKRPCYLEESNTEFIDYLLKNDRMNKEENSLLENILETLQDFKDHVSRKPRSD